MKINETLELLDHIKNAPSFMGGDSRYTNVSNSSELWLEDIKAIEKDLKFLEILKERFFIAFETYDCGSFLRVVGNEDYGEYCGLCVEAYSDNLQNDEETAFLKDYLKESNNDK